MGRRTEGGSYTARRNRRNMWDKALGRGQWASNNNSRQSPQSHQPAYDYAKAEAAVTEAKRKQEASKASALGYYRPIQQGLAAMSPELITGEQQGRMMGERRAQLGSYGQNLSSMYGDATSGVQSGIRREIGMGIAGRQANLPIELELEVGAKNREAQLGLYGAQAGVAAGMANVQTSYQYDPGLEYVKSLGYAAGRGGGGSGVPSNARAFTGAR